VFREITAVDVQIINTEIYCVGKIKFLVNLMFVGPCIIARVDE